MNIFAGNLPTLLDETRLRKLFEAFGKVKTVNIIHDFESGLSKGFGFVEMDDAVDAKFAIKNLHELNVMGQHIAVAEALPVPEKQNEFLTLAREAKTMKDNRSQQRRN